MRLTLSFSLFPCTLLRPKDVSTLFKNAVQQNFQWKLLQYAKTMSLWLLQRDQGLCSSSAMDFDRGQRLLIERNELTRLAPIWKAVSHPFPSLQDIQMQTVVQLWTAWCDEAPGWLKVLTFPESEQFCTIVNMVLNVLNLWCQKSLKTVLRMVVVLDIHSTSSNKMTLTSLKNHILEVLVRKHPYFLTNFLKKNGLPCVCYGEIDDSARRLKIWWWDIIG